LFHCLLLQTFFRFCVPIEKMNGLQLPGMESSSNTEVTVFDPEHIAPTDRVAYDSLFYHTIAQQHPELIGEDGSINEEQWHMDGGAAVSFFRQSGLPDAALAAVWTLSDIDHDNTLDREEFAVAMHLTRLARKGGNLPDVLPRSLVPEDKLLHYNVAATGLGSWTTFDSQPQSQTSVAMTAGSDGSLSVADPSALAVSAEQAAAFDKTNNSTANTSRKEGSQMPHFALMGASFEQKIALESELSKAMAKRGAKNQQQGGEQQQQQQQQTSFF